MKQGIESQPAENNHLEQTGTIQDNRSRDPRVYSPRRKHQALIGTLGIMTIVFSGCIPDLHDVSSFIIPRPAKAEEPAGKQGRKATADYTSLPRLVDKCAVTHPVGRPDIQFTRQIMKIIYVAFPNLTQQQIDDRSKGVAQALPDKVSQINDFETYFLGRPVIAEIRPGVIAATKPLDQFTTLGELVDNIKPRIPRSEYTFNNGDYKILTYLLMDFNPAFTDAARNADDYGEMVAHYFDFTWNDEAQISALRHEMGHTKGIPHNNNPRSIMNNDADPSIIAELGFTDDDITGVCESGSAASTATATATVPAQVTATATVAPSPTRDPLPYKANLPVVFNKNQYPPKPANAQISQEYKYRPVNTPTPTRGH